MVAPTTLNLTAFALNRCDSAYTEFATGQVEIRPTIRRPGWTTPIASDIPHFTMHEGNPSQFPRAGGTIEWGINTNWNSHFSHPSLASTVVVPIYDDNVNFPTYYAQFDDVVDDVASGPNASLWFNTDPTIFRCDRVAKINYWITTGAGKPNDIPNSGPLAITSFDNYHDIYVQTDSDECGCVDPLGHDGIGGNYFYHAQLWHETIGCPESDNQAALGHHVLMRNAIVNTPETHDPVYQADLVWKYSQEALRSSDAVIQNSTSTALAIRMATLHNFVGSGVEMHNFYGSVWIFNGGTSWVQVPGKYNGGW